MQLFRRYYFAKKLQSQTVIREKLQKILVQKGTRKMLMKLTQGADAIKKFTPSLGIPYLGV